jgi:hypothetical protein
MKKLFTPLLFIGVIMLNAQNDTLLFENFEAEVIDYIFDLPPNGDDDTWLNFDSDGLPDGSGGNRPNNWFLGAAFAEADGGNTVLMSNSWTNNTEQSVENYLITPPIQIIDANAVLSWKSAPRQTPRFLDGYCVVVQTGSNIETSFTDTLVKFAEFISGDSFDFDDYEFSSGFVHGSDFQFIEDAGDSARWIGVLRSESVSLAQYAGQTIYIAFVHNSTDDNLISVDDILITGTSPTNVKKVENQIGLEIFPNPAANFANIQVDLPLTTGVNLHIYSVDGKLIRTIPQGFRIKGSHNFQIDINDLPSGLYNIVVQTKDFNVGKTLIKE